MFLIPSLFFSITVLPIKKSIKTNLWVRIKSFNPRKFYPGLFSLYTGSLRIFIHGHNYYPHAQGFKMHKSKLARDSEDSQNCIQKSANIISVHFFSGQWIPNSDFVRRLAHISKKLYVNCSQSYFGAQIVFLKPILFYFIQLSAGCLQSNAPDKTPGKLTHHAHPNLPLVFSNSVMAI